MAEKTEKKPESKPAAAAAEAAPAAGKKDAPAKSGGMGGTILLVGAVMLIEAAVLIAGFKFLGGGPKTSHGADLATAPESSGGHGGEASAPAAEKGKTAEVSIIDFKAPNKQSGRTFIFDISVVAVVKSDQEKKVGELLTGRKALVANSVRTIIAAIDPEKLTGGAEPGLETFRRQVKYQLDEIVGDGLIEDVLVPRCTPIRTDY